MLFGDIGEEMILIDEHEMGICHITKDLEESYLKSCEHRKTSPQDTDYFREYIWVLLAILMNRIDNVENVLDI